MSDAVDIKLPPKIVDLMDGEARFRCCFGGRGSGKTKSFAIMSAVRGYMWGMQGREGQILCGRERLNSLSDSSLEEIKSAIRSYKFLEDFYEIGENYIRSKKGNIFYTFAGLRTNIDSIKSKAKILLCWIDEAEAVSETAWSKLVPTVREEGSEIWVTWNPENKNAATHKRFRESEPEGLKIVEMNYLDNPFFPKVLEQARLDDLKDRPDSYGHIWDGEFLQHVDGSYYAAEFQKLRLEKKITHVPYDPALSVVTAWDLGMGDSTSIWFAQYVGAEIRIIDFYECSGVGLDHYVKMLQSKPYTYGDHILPHDVRVRELGTGKSRLETLGMLGVRPITIAPNLLIDDGIQAVRSMLSRCWFDETLCDKGVDALSQYRRAYDDKNMVFKGTPIHDWTSHAADAFRYLAVGYKPPKNWGEPIKRNMRGVV